MSWLTKVTNQKLTIITGDGSEFTPIWKNATKSRELNASKFEFNNIEGSLVRRGKVSGLIIPFELWFQGEENIEQAEALDEATKDTRPWILRHPLYNEITVHPASINFDDSSQNVTKVTGEFWETIEDIYPDISINPKEDISEKLDNTTETVINDFSDNLGTPNAGLISKITKSLTDISVKLRAAAVTDIDKQNIEDSISKAFEALNTISSDAVVFMTRTAELLRTPARIYDSVQNRLNVIDESYTDLVNAFSGIIYRKDKLYFQAAGAMLMIAKAEASVTTSQDIADDQQIDNTVQDYRSRKDVITVADSIINSYNGYIDLLGSFQDTNDSTPDSFTPNANTINDLKESVISTTGQLAQIAIGEKLERIYTLPDDIGIIMLVRKLLGTYDSDVIQDFIQINQLELSEMLQIKKGRKVIYYV